MYDARSGSAVFFRYRPRDLTVLCAEAGLQIPTIHISALKRIQDHTEDYAPTGIPKKYKVDGEAPQVVGEAPQVKAETNAEARIVHHEEVDNLIWKRRTLYLVFIVSMLTLLSTAWFVRARSSVVLDIESWCPVSQFLYFAYAPIVELIVWSAPSYFEPGVVGLGHHPWLLTVFLITGIVIFFKSRSLRSAIQEQSNRGWTIGFKTQPSSTQPAAAAQPSWLKRLRTSPLINDLTSCFKRHLLPLILDFAIIFGIFFLLWSWLAPAFLNVVGHNQVIDNQLENSVTATFQFNTRDPLTAAPVMIKAGQRYRIRVEEIAIAKPIKNAPWKDNAHPADADGQRDQESLTQLLSPFARRDADENWFKVIASIGPDAAELIPIGKERIFIAKNSGRLYVFVNDVYGCYCNNQGTAKIFVEELDSVVPNATGK